MASFASIVGVMALFSAAVSSVQAAGMGNYGFMGDSPYAFMKDEDRAQFQAALTATLNAAADGETREWSAPGGRSSGKLTIVRTVDSGAAGRCRQVHIANRAAGRSEANDLVFCQSQDGKWLPGQGP